MSIGGGIICLEVALLQSACFEQTWLETSRLSGPKLTRRWSSRNAHYPQRKPGTCAMYEHLSPVIQICQHVLTRHRPEQKKH